MQKCGKEREDGEDVELGDAEELGGVHVIPVTELVCEDGFDFVGFALFDEGIEDDDVLALKRKKRRVSVMRWEWNTGTHPREAEKVGVAV